VIYAASVDEAWSMNHRAGTITCVDAKSFEVKSTIEIGGALEFAAEIGEKVFVNIEDQSKIAVIDTKKHAKIATYDIGPGEEPAGLAADAKNGVLFVGCGNKKLVAIEAATGTVISSFDIGSHCDAVAFDAESGRVYASCGDGATYVLQVKDATTFELQKPIPTARGGKCCAIDSKTHKLYVAAAPRRGQEGESKVLVFATEPGEKAGTSKTY
jgi:DNA-binding beta-propeller fold protein YncE